jgi:hypothetical protein
MIPAPQDCRIDYEKFAPKRGWDAVQPDPLGTAQLIPDIFLFVNFGGRIRDEKGKPRMPW